MLWFSPNELFIAGDGVTDDFPSRPPTSPIVSAFPTGENTLSIDFKAKI